MAKAINENQLAKEITCEEGGCKSVNVAQVKEVQKLLLKKLATYPASCVMALVEKHKPKPPEPSTDDSY